MCWQHYCFDLANNQPNSTKSVAGNDVDREHYNRDSVVPTNRSPSSILNEQYLDL